MNAGASASALDSVLRDAVPAPGEPDVLHFLARLRTCPFEDPFDRALWSGFSADRLGYAFAGGYEAALSRMLADAAESADAPTYPWPRREARLSFAVTEAGGAHPRALTTRLVREASAIVLRGKKTFATLATVADEILVLARDDEATEERADALDEAPGEREDEERPERRGKKPPPTLRLVRVRRDATGLTLEARRPTPFAPEVPHAKLAFADVEVAEEDVLPGDGYAAYAKPFRTFEDVHVLAATLGFFVRQARIAAFDRAFVEGVVGIFAALGDVRRRGPLDPVGHLALGGLFTSCRRLVAEHAREWEKAEPEVRQRWERDAPLLLVAETVREGRTAAAWRAIGDGAA